MMIRSSKRRRAVLTPDGVKNITKQQISRVVDNTFRNRAPNYDLELLGADLTIALAPVRRDSLVKARALAPFLGAVQQHLRKALYELEDTNQTRFMLNAGAWRYVAREKKKGIAAGDMRSNDRLVGSIGEAQ